MLYLSWFTDKMVIYIFRVYNFNQSKILSFRQTSLTFSPAVKWEFWHYHFHLGILTLWMVGIEYPLPPLYGAPLGEKLHLMQSQLYPLMKYYQARSRWWKNNLDNWSSQLTHIVKREWVLAYKTHENQKSLLVIL